MTASCSFDELPPSYIPEQFSRSLNASTSPGRTGPAASRTWRARRFVPRARAALIPSPAWPDTWQVRFQRVDADFQDIMGGVSDDPRVFSLLKRAQLGDDLEAVLDQLERCQKARRDRARLRSRWSRSRGGARPARAVPEGTPRSREIEISMVEISRRCSTSSSAARRHAEIEISGDLRSRELEISRARG